MKFEKRRFHLREIFRRAQRGRNVLEKGQFFKHLIIWETIMFDVDGTKVWFIDEV